MSEQALKTIEKPLVVMHEIDDDGSVHCLISLSERHHSHVQFGILLCDLVRHVALAFDVPEDDVWEWVDWERREPTTKISRLL